MSKVRRPDRTTSGRRKDRPKKRKQSFDPKTAELNDESFTSTSAKKLKIQDEKHVPEDAILQHDYDPLPSDVSSAIKSIYEELSKEEFLERFDSFVIDFFTE
ncbi:hypothetical protein EVAR_33805_1 [Eumeta japonica]|uniref:Uncharacterized protein n=1 Tax=Eumeta variegata TaxID=151549 RepID=A0A4C1VTG7_EUMVA|nr:hypothetical protein EVAR_33805_1 [Eumeta japonica]